MILPFHFDFALRHPRQRHLHRIEHILNENAVSRGGIVDQHVRDRADELAVLDNRRAAHSEYDASIGDSCLFQ